MVKSKIQRKISGILSGVSGEYFVAAQLTRLGYIASITLKNTKGVDVLAANEDASRSIAIQVKTNQGRRKSWLLDRKAESNTARNLFYVFVNLKDKISQPDFYIVPSSVVANQIKKYHTKWLATPGKRVKKHRDTAMRGFEDLNDKYLGRWDILGL